MNLTAMPAGVPEALARLGAATAMTVGPADVKARLRLAEAGQLGETDALALRAELEALTVLLAGLPARTHDKTPPGYRERC